VVKEKCLVKRVYKVIGRKGWVDAK
jgi:hypothetical protein